MQFATSLLLLASALLGAQAQAVEPPGFEPAVFGYDLVSGQYPHDSGAFTEGLLLDRGECDSDGACESYLWESTGCQFYPSTIRKVNLTSGHVLEEHQLPGQDWGEGLTLINDTYPRENISEGAYSTPVALPEGWGLTNNGSHLIASDGSATLYFLDPDTLEIVQTVQVTDGGQPVTRMNELEYVSGLIWANIWTTECIAIIVPGSGLLLGWLQVSGFRESLQQQFPTQYPPMDVVNGIAYDGNVSVYLTGKNFPRMWEIQLAEPPANADLTATRQACKPSS